MRYYLYFIDEQMRPMCCCQHRNPGLKDLRPSWSPQLLSYDTQLSLQMSNKTGYFRMQEPDHCKELRYSEMKKRFNYAAIWNKDSIIL